MFDPLQGYCLRVSNEITKLGDTLLMINYFPLLIRVSAISYHPNTHSSFRAINSVSQLARGLRTLVEKYRIIQLQHKQFQEILKLPKSQLVQFGDINAHLPTLDPVIVKLLPTVLTVSLQWLQKVI